MLSVQFSNCLASQSHDQVGIDFKSSTFYPTYLHHFEDFEEAAVDPALWHVRRGSVGTACGAAHGEQALRFRSALQDLPRMLVTTARDVRSGGVWEFSLQYATGNAGLGCEAVTAGTVSFQYTTGVLPPLEPTGTSIDEVVTWWNIDNANWVDIVTEFPRRDYRRDGFSVVRVEIPPEAYTSATYFRWVQGNCFQFSGMECPATCTCDRDYNGNNDVWSIDNIKFFKHLETGWDTSDRWRAFKRNARAQVDTSKCCYDCYTCENPQESFLDDDGCADAVPFDELDDCHQEKLTEACQLRPTLEEYTLPDNRAIEHEYVLAVAGFAALLSILIRIVSGCGLERT